MSDLQDVLRRLVARAGHWTEVRYHARHGRALSVRHNEVVEMASQRTAGVGLRVLVDGTWGFAATSDLTAQGLERALERAEGMARALSPIRKKRVRLAEGGELARGDYLVPGYVELEAMPLEEKFRVVRESEAKLRASSDRIESAQCRYTEAFEDKLLVTSDGVDARVRLVRPSIRFSATGADGSRRTNGSDSVGGTGAWACLFHNRSTEAMIDQAAAGAVDLLSASDAEGGRKRVILSPAMVGLLSHEAIGHTVEADFVSAGSVAAGKIGERGGLPARHPVRQRGAASTPTAPGASCPSTTRAWSPGAPRSSENGQPRQLPAQPRVGGRVRRRADRQRRAPWTYSDEPLIRMRNTYIEPGDVGSRGDDRRASTTATSSTARRGGQADATAEFMFGATRVRRIRDGQARRDGRSTSPSRGTPSTCCSPSTRSARTSGGTWARGTAARASRPRSTPADRTCAAS